MTGEIASLKRVIAIHVGDKYSQDMADAAVNSALSMTDDVVIVFAPSSIKKIDRIDSSRWMSFPLEADNIPKQKNFIIKHFENAGFKGFLHIIEPCARFNNSTKSYMSKLEATMNVLDYDVHLSTTTDRCNYVFNKFCPRLTLDIDDESMKSQLGLPDKLYFTSHSNVSCLTMNLGAFKDGNVPMFDERFSIGMFFIIEFLAKRRLSKRLD